MIAFFRLAAILLGVLSVIYLVASVHGARLRRARLLREWAELGETDPTARAAFVAEGMREWRHGFRHRMLLAIYVVPILLIALIVYLSNFT